jgi:hypothetical protein
LNDLWLYRFKCIFGAELLKLIDKCITVTNSGVEIINLASFWCMSIGNEVSFQINPDTATGCGRPPFSCRLLVEEVPANTLWLDEIEENELECGLLM